MAQEATISFKEAKGVIRFKMTNNYMFRFILQKNKKVLTGLISALLHLDPKNIKKIEITNPINLSEDVLPVIHIGFLDYTPFPEVPEFYSKYVMTNVKNKHVYSSKFVLRVINLKRIDLATEEDKAYNIHYWASLFKAETWEELKMLAENNEYLQEAAESLYVANADEIVRQQCRAREDAERRERTILRNYRLAKEELEKAKEEIARLQEEVEKLRSEE